MILFRNSVTLSRAECIWQTQEVRTWELWASQLCPTAATRFVSRILGPTAAAFRCFIEEDSGSIFGAFASVQIVTTRGGQLRAICNPKT